MARKKVIVKHLAAIQNFGSIDVLCSDKTGTLTSGDMVLERSLDPFGQSIAAAPACWRISTASSKRESAARWMPRFCTAGRRQSDVREAR